MNTIKITARSLTGTIQTYLLDRIDLSGYEIDLPPKTTRQKLLVLHGIFLSEYGYNLNKNKSDFFVMKDYLQGLPSTINIEFMNFEILKLLQAWGVADGTENDDQQDKLIDQYWNEIAKKLNSLFNKALKGEVSL